MDEAVMTVALFGGIASVAWSAAYAWGKWLQHRHDASRALRPGDQAAERAADTARVMRIEAAVEELAVELERVAEAQRYTARLLAERLPAPPATSRALPEGQAPRVITPH